MKTYIQIGSNVGEDDFYKKIEFLTEKSRVILIEPNNDLIQTLEKNYTSLKERHEIIICNKAISTNNNQTYLYKYTSDGHSSLINRRSHQQVTEILPIEAITFNKLCEVYQIQEVEYLCMDTEGLDYEIIISIDFEKVKINSICFEVWDHEFDDLNNKFQTGNTFFLEQVKPKLKKYFTFKQCLFQNGGHNATYIRK
jgi:FkbM family methyltransferase